MPITPLSGSGGIDEVWGDLSGGSILFSFTHPNYTSLHQLRVRPFDTTGTALYTGSPVGVVTGVEQEAENLVTLIAACYAADTTIGALTLAQTLPDHTGEIPYDFTFGGGTVSAGTGGGTSLPVFNVVELVSRGADGSRWRLTLPGVSNTHESGTGAKDGWAGASSSPFLDLVKYLSGVTNGPTHAAKTGVVTHNGVPIAFAPGNFINTLNKRLRRHFKVV